MATTFPRPMRADARRNRARVIEAAEALLAKHGMSATMRDVARAAQVGLGTVYRHFATKEELYQAIARERVLRLLDAAHSAAEADDAGSAFFDFFTLAVVESTGEKALVDALVSAGLNPKAATSGLYRELEDATELLLYRAQAASAVRDDVARPELLALITSTCIAADRQQWNPELRDRVLAVIFDGLRRR